MRTFLPVRPCTAVLPQYSNFPPKPIQIQFREIAALLGGGAILTAAWKQKTVIYNFNIQYVVLEAEGECYERNPLTIKLQ